MIVKGILLTLILSLFYSKSSNALHWGHLHKHHHHHHQAQVCLTPPNTLKKIQTHIDECQNEVKTIILNEAFRLLHNDGYPSELGLPHYDWPEQNFTETDKDLLKLLDQIGDDDHVHHTIDDTTSHKLPILPSSETASLNYNNLNLHSLPTQFDHTNIGWNPWLQKNHIDQKSFPYNLPHKDAIKASTSYIYFDVPYDEKRRKRDAETISINEYDIHPAAISFKERRLAGCLLHCVYEKFGAIDVSGWPTLDGLVSFYSDGVNEHGFFVSTLRATDYCLKGASIKHNVNRHSIPSFDLKCDLAFDIFDCVSDKITEYCNYHNHPGGVFHIKRNDHASAAKYT